MGIFQKTINFAFMWDSPGDYFWALYVSNLYE